MALAAKGKKKKSKKGYEGGTKHNDGKKKDMTKVKCFAYQKFGNYVGQFPNKKRKKQWTTTSVDIDEYVDRFKREFSLFIGGCRQRVSYITNRGFEDKVDHSMIIGN